MEGLLAYLAAMRRDAASAMTGLSGDVSACALAKDGRSFPAYKFHEGRAAALGELARRLRRDGADTASAIDRTVNVWQERQRLAESRGRDWQAYTAGGVDALEALREDIGRAGDDAPS